VSNNVVSYTVIVKVENLDGTLLPGMTCAVDFIVERSVNALMISNAALRYQPTSLSGEKIADMVFNASLAGMDDEQRQAALEARTQARAAQAQNSQNANSGLQGLMMGNQQQGMRMMGGGGGGGRQGRQGGQQGQGRTAAPAVVFRNLWYMNGEGKLEVTRVRTGVSSGSFTEIFADDDFEGRQFILREKI
jgi:HlyD family secretion protein